MSSLNRSPQPAESWELDDWLKASDPDMPGPRLMEMAYELSARLALANDDEAVRERVPKRYHDWKVSGIPYRVTALAVIAALGRLASKNEIDLLNGGLLREHARIFLISKACKQKFAPLDDPELHKLSSGRRTEIENNLTEQARYVRPPAPPKLFGRAIDLDRVVDGMRSAPICVIDSVAGNGKTALAWFAAQLAVQRGLVYQFSWNTDKRVMVNPKTGTVESTADDPLVFSRILESMASRFNWLDVSSAPPSEWEERCAERLQKGLYLIIIDNLETMGQYKDVVEQLSRLLQPRKDMSPQMSRALITTREQVDLPGCRRVDIQGLDKDASHELIRSIEPGLLGQRVDPLTDLQIDRLHEATFGNPLFLRIALSRYSIYSRQFNDIIDHLQNGTNFNAAFDNLFGALYAGLSDDARWLAATAVNYPVITFKNLSQAFIGAGGDREGFDLALAQLIDLRILDAYSTGDTEYVFHPLIKAYIMARMRGNS